MLTKCKYVDNLQFMRTDKQIFIDWLRCQMGVKRVMKGRDLAEKTHMHPGTISGYLTGKSKGPRNVEDRRVICEALKGDYDQVIRDGRKEDVEPTDDLESRLAKIEASLPSMEMQAQASNVIPYIMDRFQDKPQAESLIAALAEIETHDPHGFSLISGMIHHCHNEIKKRGFEKKGC